MKIAVIILNYNSSDDCRKCVSYLKRQKGVELELVLVDNCSPDSDKVEALCCEQGCTFIASSENRGYNAGNNIGLRYAANKGYKYALIANPDMEFPQSNYIRTLINTIEVDEEIVVVGSDIVGIDGVHQNPMIRDGNWTTSFGWMIEPFKNENAAYDFIDNYTVSHYCAKVNGCCLMVRLDFFSKIGFFDEYPFLYGEEPILSRQVEMAGKRMYYTVEVQAVHHHIASTKGDPVKRFRQWKKSRIYFIDRYSGDSWFGKLLALLSTLLYVEVFIFSRKMKYILNNYLKIY